MRVDEMRAGREETLELRCESGTFAPVPTKGEEGRLVQHGDDVILGVKGHAWTVRGTHARAARSLQEITGGGLPAVTWVASSSAKSVMLHVRTFAAAMRLADEVTVRVDDATREEARGASAFSGTVEAVAKWLERELLLDAAPGDDPSMRRAVVSAGEGPGVRPLRVYGARLSADLAPRDGGLVVERLVRGHAPAGVAARLLIAQISFRDASAAGALAASTRASLNEAVRASGSYLEIWHRYAALERDQMEARAADFGALRYESCERRDGQWHIELARESTLDARFDALPEGEWSFRLSTSPPEAPEAEPTKGRTKRSSDDVMLRFVRRTQTSLVLEPLDDDQVVKPPTKGWLSFSTVGDEARIKRRERAEEQIREGSGPMPHLGLIIEGKPSPVTRYKNRDAMSRAVRESFGRAPTDRQREAVSIAINTPDIAMIQGPPGTGKTSVIAAIERRLAELEGDEVGVMHKILVTSAQHDAVENVMARTSVFGIPAMKVGARRDGDGAGLDGAELFQKDQAEKLRASLMTVTEAERLRSARDRVVAMLVTPGVDAQNAAALREVRAAVEGLVPPSLVDELDARARALARTVALNDDGRSLARRAAEGLRYTATQFEDDGRSMAQKALVRLAGVLRSDERELLERCARWEGSSAPEWIGDVARVREALVDRLQPEERPETRRLDEETRALLTRVVDAMREGLGTRRTLEESVIGGFLHEIETDPEGVRKTLESYTAVLAATLQHSVAKPMRRVRGISEGSVEFESVLVDEAARANPLDLFIPLGTARRRIVLVGDHRQLPHMLEPDVERSLRDGDLTAETERALKESLFQRLWEILKAREKADGVPRTVTLDEQFRMHPTLGDFVSRSFYERKGDARIRSPRTADDFRHGLCAFTRGEERVAAWVDVPRGEGGEHGGRSRARQCEAVRVAKLARSILDADASLSVGVISFYSAQVRAIASELGRLDVMEEHRGEWKVAEDWRTGRGRNGEAIERFRLGTVDAFQGKEFDVVILSITRSNELPEGTDAQRRKKYGHLMLDNRLCVATSRQRRLLISVGDLAFVRSASALPALQGFIELCEGPYGLVA
jgi:hypothetical protein